MMTKPSVGRIVHFSPPDTSRGECWAALVTQVEREDGLPMSVFDPVGMIFPAVAKFDEDGKAAGTWHWPERV